MFLSRLYVRIKGELLTLRNSRSHGTQDGEAFLDRIGSLLSSKAADTDTPEKREQKTHKNREIEERWDRAVEKHRSGETKATQDHTEASAQSRPNPRTLG